MKSSKKHLVILTTNRYIELTIEERQEALKKSRWNVFMYLGIAALLFAFALYPFMSTSMQVDEGFGSADKSITVGAFPYPERISLTSQLMSK